MEEQIKKTETRIKAIESAYPGKSSSGILSNFKLVFENQIKIMKAIEELRGETK